MNVMSRDYVEAGRSRQKQRTRDQLLAAAWKLMESGDTPRVEDAAEAAGISRTTAYRYFASQAELLAAAFPETARESMLPDPAPDGARSTGSLPSRPAWSTASRRPSTCNGPCSASRSATHRMTSHSVRVG